jgi:hypothetical protein
MVAILLGLTLVCATCPTRSEAVTSTGSGYYIEDAMVKFFRLAKNVIVPTILLVLVITIGAQYGFNRLHLGEGMMRLILSGAIIAGGIETVLLIVGGTVVTAVVLP